MAYFFSPSTLGFYVDAIHGANMPSDVVPVDADEYDQLMADNAKGMPIKVSTSGRPFAADRQLSAEAIAGQRIAKAKDLLLQTDNIVMRAYENGLTFPASWKNYREALRAVANGSSTALPTRPAGGILALLLGSFTGD